MDSHILSKCSRDHLELPWELPKISQQITKYERAKEQEEEVKRKKKETKKEKDWEKRKIKINAANCNYVKEEKGWKEGRKEVKKGEKKEWRNEER